MLHYFTVQSSVAYPVPVFLGHPDPDPGKYQILILYPQKDHCNSILSLYKNNHNLLNDLNAIVLYTEKYYF